MKEQQSNYQSYMIRIWYVENEGEMLWRATLESASTGERVGFSSIQGLLDYLDGVAELMSHRAAIERKKRSH